MNPQMPREEEAKQHQSPSSETLKSPTKETVEKPPFSKDLLIMDAARYYPEIIEIFMDYGLHCVGCHISGFETIEEGAMGHGIVGDDFENLIADAQERIKESALKLR